MWLSWIHCWRSVSQGMCTFIYRDSLVTTSSIKSAQLCCFAKFWNVRDHGRTRVKEFPWKSVWNKQQPKKVASFWHQLKAALPVWTHGVNTGLQPSFKSVKASDRGQICVLFLALSGLNHPSTEAALPDLLTLIFMKFLPAWNAFAADLVRRAPFANSQRGD